MIALTRSHKPGILERRGPEWTKKFQEKRARDPKARPPSSQYRHPDVLDALVVMSHSKCFYCESLLDADEYEVDHHVEVNADDSRAFDWTNLYLACRACNGRKLPEKSAPCADCVDPCVPDPCPPDADPAAHFAFDDECILPRKGSPRGRQTIRKYRLDRGELAYRRARQLIRFQNDLNEILARQRDEGRTSWNEAERERLDRYRQPEHAFSAMFACVLKPYLG